MRRWSTGAAKAPVRKPGVKGLLRRALAPATKVAGSRLRERMLVAGNLLSWGFHGVAFAPGVDPSTIWTGVTEALHRIRRAGRLTGQTDFDLSVQGNATVRLVTVPAGYLPALARAVGPDFRCTVIRRGEEILGFVTTLRDGDTAIGYYIGFDRAAAAGGLPIYLRLLQATIGDAIEWRCRRLSLGRTALEPKAALGARPEPVECWLRHRVPALNWALHGILGAVPHAEAPERHPFKAGQSSPG